MHYIHTTEYCTLTKHNNYYNILQNTTVLTIYYSKYYSILQYFSSGKTGAGVLLSVLMVFILEI